MLNAIKDSVRNFNPALGMTDFEFEMQKALQFSFQSIKSIKGFFCILSNQFIVGYVTINCFKFGMITANSVEETRLIFQLKIINLIKLKMMKQNFQE